MPAMISTWQMSLDGAKEGYALLQQGGSAGDAVQAAIMRVEDEPAYTSVGFGGLPARNGHVYLDAAWMDGRTLRMGGVMSAENIRNPIRAARALCGREINCLLAGRGAEQFAISQGLPMRDMRTEASLNQWREELQKTEHIIDAYREHDTVCVIALDDEGRMIVGTSTSGLFMKEPGRVGDSPIIGSGFYCDERYGAAAATGLGEDIMRGCLSYEIVSLMKRGLTPEQACAEALANFVERKLALGEDEGSISVIAMNPRGEYGAATTLRIFPFAAACNADVKLHAARKNGTMQAVRCDEVAGEP